ncbi:MAG: hypothetical protein Q8M11_20715 [Sulfuritalea sp.]|nr:hypothetical protein [Sulfuritalea sp.]MDP1983152.1 hypothetical protein [Sulfuritalea sp.]
MLNELIQAARAMPPVPPPLHKELKALPKSTAYWIKLASDGKIVGVTAWTNDIADLRKWQPGGLGFSFPIFNVSPLFAPRLSDDTLKALSRVDDAGWPDLFETIENACNDLACSWLESDTNQSCVIKERYRKSLEDIPIELLETMQSCGIEHPVLQSLVSRLRRQTPEQFFLSLAEQIESQLRQSRDPQLFKLYCATSTAEGKKNLNILLDTSDWSDMGLDAYPVASRKTASFLNELLTRRDGNISASVVEDDLRDAYGLPAIRTGEKFDDVNTGLGKIILRAMTKDAPCQYRYGKADADSFVVGESSRRLAKGALEFLTAPNFKGKTWQFRAGNLVLIYPERELPALLELDTADFCSLPNDNDDDLDGSANFVARAERIAMAFDGKPLDSEVPVHLVVLRKPDGHRTKVVAHQFFTMAHLIDAAKHWKTGADECPSISFAKWGVEKGKRDDIVPTVPFPGEVVSWLNTYWVRNGDSQGKGNFFRLEDALTLLLANDGTEKTLAERGIRDAIVNWSGFLAHHGSNQNRLANAQSPGNLILKAKDAHANALRCLPAILSLLLHKLGHTKEQTMNSPAFLVGRLLALADALHFQYCLGVRNGSTPPQLLGNALMQTALETPQVALALYAQRILPYQAWAKTCAVPKADRSPEKLAKFLLGELATTCEEVALSEILERANDAAKAQMILGYLANTKSDE